MKNIKLVFVSVVFLFFSNWTICFGKGKTILPFFQKEKLINHLVQVNAQWKLKENLSPSFQNKISFQNNEQRIQLHLMLVESFLRNKNLPHLSFAQKNNRERYLQRLREYAKSGIFPKNNYHKTSTPYFVDNEGVKCAVGSLVFQSGAGELVSLIHEKSNNKYIDELQKEYAEIGLWASENGFSIEELAWIQPSYCAGEYYYGLGNGGGPNGKIHTMISNETDNLLFIGGDFTEMDGVNASGVIGWDGTQWITLGEGINGEVFCMTYHDDKLFIGGKFKLFGETEFSNVAYWNGNNWTGWNMVDEGSVFALQSYHGVLYAGGDIKFIEGNTVDYLAYYDELNSTWSNSGLAFQDGQIVVQEGMFSVDNVVYALTVWDDLLYVGGAFYHTSPNVDNPNVVQYDVKYLAAWYDYLWLGGDQALHKIYSMDTLDGNLFLMGQYDSYPAFSTNETGSWELMIAGGHGEDDNLIHGIVTHSDTTFIYGNHERNTAIGVSEFQSLIGVNLCDKFNKTVRAGVYFQKNYYFAGDFTEIIFQNTTTEFNGIVFSNMKGTPQNVTVVNEDIEIEKSNISVKNIGREVFINYKNLNRTTQFSIYNLNGIEIKTMILKKGSQDFSFFLNEIPAGYYFFQIKNQSFQESGKFSFF